MRISHLFLPAAMSASVFLTSCGEKPKPDALIPAEQLLTDTEFKDAVKCSFIADRAWRYLYAVPEDREGYKAFFMDMATGVGVKTQSIVIQKDRTHTRPSPELSVRLLQDIAAEMPEPTNSPFVVLSLLHQHCAKFESDKVRTQAPEKLEALQTELETSSTDLRPEPHYRPKTRSHDIVF